MRCLAFSFLLILASCAGYQVENRDNPLDRYAIESLAIPQFVNYSNIAGVAEMLTKEFTFLFSQYNGLKLYSGENPKAQAILVGVVDGPRKIKDTVGIEQTVLTTGALKESIGARQEFAVPISARYELTVHITIIKDPNYNELQMIKTGGFQNNNIPRVVIDKRLPLTGVYNLTTAETTSPDSLGTVSFTKNRASFRQSLGLAAEGFTNTFKEVVLNAF